MTRPVCSSRSANGTRGFDAANSKTQIHRGQPVAWDFVMERVTGIGPASRAWEALILPLNYTRDDAEPSTSKTGPVIPSAECGVRRSSLVTM